MDALESQDGMLFQGNSLSRKRVNEQILVQSVN